MSKIAIIMVEEIKVPENMVRIFIHIVESILSLFSFQYLEKLDLEILDFWLFTELPILEWFSTWFFKYSLIPVRTYFQTLIAL